MSYTTEQEGVIWQIQKDLRRTGDPSLATRINIAWQANTPFDEIMLLFHGAALKDVKPEVPIVQIPDHPPFTGAGATTIKWRAFAKQVSDMEPEVVDSMGRNDIIVVLADKGIIVLPDE